VTLRWLRLGGLIAAPLAALAAVILWLTGQKVEPGVAATLVAGGVLMVAQLMAVQLGKKALQRVLAGAAFAVTVGGLAVWVSHPGVLIRAAEDEPVSPVALVAPDVAVSLALSAGILGGFLMTMLLGHAYLTAGGEMTQKPFARLVLALAALLILRAAASVGLALVPWWGTQEGSAMERTWTVAMLLARYAVGLAVPAAFTYMTYRCVQLRANQSATGILYVAGVLVIIGEGIALALLGTTGRAF
jgi:hypothetical protein